MESAVTLTKSLRWDIQSLGTRLAKAASTEEMFRRDKKNSKPRQELKAEIRLIVQDIKRLLLRIEDAVPLINLAITTSGASLSTSLPPTVSPSRLLQASTCLTAGDTKFSLDPTATVQIGPSFILSVYMLFAGHTSRPREEDSEVRDTTWKEVIHKAHVKLVRVPFNPPLPSIDVPSPELKMDQKKSSPTPTEGLPEAEVSDMWIPSDGHETEFSYHLILVEDLDDGRVHSFENGEHQPMSYEEVPVAGIREVIPIHQFSKIFYADTGKILNIGTDPEVNSPILLLKRDVNAPHPRQMMEQSEQQYSWNPYGSVDEDTRGAPCGDEDSQADIDEQLRSESSVLLSVETTQTDSSETSPTWRFPPDLDPEWLALEVYTEAEDDSSDDGHDTSDDSAYMSSRPDNTPETSRNPSLNAGMTNLRLRSATPGSPFTPEPHQVSTPAALPGPAPTQATSPFGPVRSSLSLLEMLIRLMALQQYKQTSHLAIPDELLNFFLLESSTSGAGADAEQRRRTRFEAKQKVGFDPYDDTPMKRRDENQGNEPYQHHSRGGTPYSEYDARRAYHDEEPSWSREQSVVSPESPDTWLLRSREHSSRSRQQSTDIASSPMTPYVPRRAARPLDHVKQARRAGKAGSPLGRGMSAETDSSLGTSPGTRGTPSLGD